MELIIKIEKIFSNNSHKTIDQMPINLQIKYHTEIHPVMLIPGFSYLMKDATFASQPIEIIFSHWEHLPTNKNLSNGVKIYYNLPTNNEIEHFTIIRKNRHGTFAGHNNFRFYKDYDNIL